jgi:hypothetical protein
MAITSLINHIANHGIDGSVTIGANTPAPYGAASLTGFVDGTGPQNASKNMAEFYNRQVFAAKHLIEAAGLTWDPANWAQMTEAVAKIAGGLDGGTCPNTGPAAAPTLANPYTQYTSALGEKWEWVSGSWNVVAKRYGTTITSSVVRPILNNTTTLIHSLTTPRNGTVAVSMYSKARSVGNTIVSCSNYLGLGGVAGSACVDTDRGTVAVGDSNLVTTSLSRVVVTAGQTVDAWVAYTNTGGVTCNLEDSFLSMQYVD